MTVTSIALYELTAQYRELAEKLSSMDLDVTTVADTIEASGITDEIAVKAQGIEMVARTLEMHSPAIKAEIDRMQALMKQREKTAAGLREYLKTNMQASQITKLESPLFKIRLQDNPAAVDVFDSSLIPAEFMKQPETPPPFCDKTAIKKAINAGTEVPGARLTVGQRLVVT